ncbi:MAG: hypothetical protein JSW73_02735 [Candidatus Woesearchaeota archaeon]|nr:MAG: hypothetical protein JSW73_02735 [Candidatus Woesearchaeota archaeon]
MLVLGAVLGFAGGMIRALFGLIKKPPKEGIEFRKLITMLLGAGAIGLFTIIFVNGDFKLSLLAGYGGTDFIENIWKIKMKDVKI